MLTHVYTHFLFAAMDLKLIPSKQEIEVDLGDDKIIFCQYDKRRMANVKWMVEDMDGQLIDVKEANLAVSIKIKSSSPNFDIAFDTDTSEPFNS